MLLQSNLEKKYHPSGLRDANKLQLSETFFSIWKSRSAKAKKTKEKIFFVLCCSEHHKKEVRTCFLGLGRQKNQLYASVCQLLKKLAAEDKPLLSSCSSAWLAREGENNYLQIVVLRSLDRKNKWWPVEYNIWSLSLKKKATKYNVLANLDSCLIISRTFRRQEQISNWYPKKQIPNQQKKPKAY